MRFLIKALLAATALVPAAASAQDGGWARWETRGRDSAERAPRNLDQPRPATGDRDVVRAERQQQRMARTEQRQVRIEQREARGEGNRNVERAARQQADFGVRADVDVQRAARERAANRLRGDWNRDDRRSAPALRNDVGVPPRQAQIDRRAQVDRLRDDRRDTARRDYRPAPGFLGARDGQQGYRADRRDGVWNRQPQYGYNGYRNDGWRNDTWRDDRSAWNRTWRSDNRYDWNRYRQSNRSAYRLPRYYAPYGWDYGYRRFGVGVTLSSILWDENYWIEDPYAYSLPEAYGPYRWVRYYNDALLVDIRDGRVLDVVHDIFW